MKMVIEKIFKKIRKKYIVTKMLLEFYIIY